MQNGNTRTMIFNVPKLVSYVSHFMTLYPGRHHQHGHAARGRAWASSRTPVFLKGGETMRLGIQGLGEQKQRVVAT